MCRFRASLCSLPPELIEEIIITSALLGDVRAPSILAQTCRTFRTLVYHQMHRHLWREMFLILFDDPRPAHDVRAHGRALPQLQHNPNNKGKDKRTNRLASHDFPWEDEYKMRIWTESFILRRTQRPLSGSSSPRISPPDLPSTDDELYTVLETLVRVISTAAPLPYHTLARMASHCPPRSPPHPHPIFSPVLIVAHAHPALGHGSRNISWLARVLAHGLPHTLMARLTVLDKNGEVDIQKKPVKWDGLLAKLVAQVGLMTPFYGTPHHTEVGHEDGEDRDTVTPESWDLNQDQETAYHLSDDDSDFEPQPESESPGDSDEESENDVDSDEVFHATVVSATTSQEGVRRLARLRVYNMAYLHSSRAFGPFLPLETHHTSSSSPDTQTVGSGAVEGEDEMLVDHHNPMRHCSPSTVVPPVPAIPEINPESFLSTVAGAIRSNLDLEGNNSSQLHDDNDDGVDDDSNETVRDVVVVAESGGHGSNASAPLSTPMPTTNISGMRRMYAPGIPGDQPLHRDFDWAWIAAARQVIELNLRDLLRRSRHQNVLRALLSLEGLRSCSAPGFPAAAPEPAVDLGEDGEGGRTFKDGEGWDWAGVEGQWRRCVCWMDYRDLIGNNAKPLAARFRNPALDEVMRIIPFTLHITHYSRAPASWPGRPKIHVAGYAPTDTPAGTMTMAESENIKRRLSGTVEMTASGDVRWTVLSFREDGQGRWFTQGVQIGGRGSAMGVIGMWTSAEHELSDPLGPFWAWKVGLPDVQVSPITMSARLQGPSWIGGGTVPSHGAGETEDDDDGDDNS